jgi:hypothetical protein
MANLLKPAMLCAALSLAAASAQQVGVFTIPPASPTSSSTYTGYAYCIDQYGRFVPYCNPGLGSGYYQYTGGHIHEDSTHISNSYSGYLTASDLPRHAHRRARIHHGVREYL